MCSSCLFYKMKLIFNGLDHLSLLLLLLFRNPLSNEFIDSVAHALQSKENEFVFGYPADHSNPI